ncbi:MAG TPA: beta-ketoacyl-ACP synthase III [Candidatus Omnitrophota bacterium]|nr:beta-ketoacyl-ACP synthase III [Candidatus Omnitrophota bacterium]
MKKVGFIGIGSYVPEKILTNADLEKIVDTSDEWITSRTGIKERRIIAQSEATSDLAYKAALQALAEAKLKPEQIDLIIVATITPDMQFPSTACFVQHKLGATNAFCFDVAAACAGFVYAVTIAKQFIARGALKNALVIGSETLSTITDWQDRNTCVLFGDGAGACVLSEVKSGGILSSYLGSDGSMSDILMVPGGGSRNPASHETIDQRQHFIKMRGNELFKIAVNVMAEAACKAVEKAGLKADDIDLVIPHQANIRIIMAVAKKLGLTEEKVFFNIEKYGNTSSASTIIALTEAVKIGRVRKGDIILLDAFGAGLTWGACVIQW